MHTHSYWYTMPKTTLAQPNVEMLKLDKEWHSLTVGYTHGSGQVALTHTCTIINVPIKAFSNTHIDYARGYVYTRLHGRTDGHTHTQGEKTNFHHLFSA